MQRYWDIKKGVMDCILFYRFGEWYVLYFEDLILANKYIDIMVTPHIGSRNMGFHSGQLSQNVEILTQKGFKVAVAEQRENRDAMESRLKSNKGKKGAKKGEEEDGDDEEAGEEDADGAKDEAMADEETAATEV